MGNHTSSQAETRTVVIGQHNSVFPDNKAVSSKYSVWNFIPRNLYEQFRRLANFYFLCMSIIPLLIPSPVDSWACFCPLLLVTTISAAKQGYEDYLRHRADSIVNNDIVTVLRNGVAQDIKSQNVCVGDIIRIHNESKIPCDAILLISSQADSSCHVTTANLDGETNLKSVFCPADCGISVDNIAYLEGFIECELPSADLYCFCGRIEMSFRSTEVDTNSRYKYVAPLTADNLLLRGSRLKNSELVFGCVVYTGQDTKLALNSLIKHKKSSSLERSINQYLMFFFGIMMVEVVISVALEFYTEKQVNYGATHRYMKPAPPIGITYGMYACLSYVVLYYYIIPISLYVTLELTRFLGTLFFQWDSEMSYQGKYAICNTSDLNEDLGQVEYLFTDKTGTLTENEMCFVRCSVEGTAYVEFEGVISVLPVSGDDTQTTPLNETPPELDKFLLAMCLCHTVKCDHKERKQAIPDYQAASADEKALVQAAARCGIIYLGEEDGLLTVNFRGDLLKFRKLEVLEFTSDRKLMSVIVREETGVIWLYCKGADSNISSLITEGALNITLRHVSEFAKRGLRTLLFGSREMSEPEFTEVKRQLQLARTTLNTCERERLLGEASGRCEEGLRLLGCSAVEDRLQDNVAETLERVKAAGIKVWILTGDKVETAVSVAFACGHFKPGTIQLYLTELDKPDVFLQQLNTIRGLLWCDHLSQFGLVLDGNALSLAMFHAPKAFREVALRCDAVICCRLSPKQKSTVVAVVKNSRLKPITAAIGDGANDVAMIQKAHIGFGLMGREGRQAVRSSDFALPRFQCLARALLVHGHWYYLRATTLIQYFFYKNIVFITPQVYFTFYNGFSSQVLYNSIFLVLYNTLFSASPILVYALMEQNFAAHVLFQYPQLYKRDSNNNLMNWTHFTYWFLFGLWHSIVIYFVPLVVIDWNPIFLGNSSPMDLAAFGTTIMHLAVIVVNMKLWLHSSYWTLLFILSLFSSVLGFIVFTALYSTFLIVTNEEPLYYVYWYLLMSPAFWLLNIIVIVISLTPDCVARTIIQMDLCGRGRMSNCWKFGWPVFGKQKGMFVLGKSY